MLELPDKAFKAAIMKSSAEIKANARNKCKGKSSEQKNRNNKKEHNEHFRSVKLNI